MLIYQDGRYWPDLIPEEFQPALKASLAKGGFCPTPQKGPIQIFRADFGLLELLRASEAKTLV
jgi:hypothetical protein